MQSTALGSFLKGISAIVSAACHERQDTLRGRSNFAPEPASRTGPRKIQAPKAHHGLAFCHVSSGAGAVDAPREWAGRVSWRCLGIANTRSHSITTEKKPAKNDKGTTGRGFESGRDGAL